MYTHIYTHTRMHTHIHAHIHIHTCVHVHTHTHTHTRTHSHIHTHTHACIHTHTHSRTHTHSHSSLKQAHTTSCQGENNSLTHLLIFRRERLSTHWILRPEHHRSRHAWLSAAEFLCHWQRLRRRFLGACRWWQWGGDCVHCCGSCPWRAGESEGVHLYSGSWQRDRVGRVQQLQWPLQPQWVQSCDSHVIVTCFLCDDTVGIIIDTH